MAKRMQKKLNVALGGVSLGKKDTAKITCGISFEEAGMDANEVLALLAEGQLHCRLDQGIAKQGKLPLPEGDVPPTTVEFDATCHRVSMAKLTATFGLSFPKSAASANTLGEFAGQLARLLVTRTADIDTDNVLEEEEVADNDNGKAIH